MPVEGVRFKFTAAEIQDHLLKRAEYHEARAKQKQDEIPTLKESAGKIAQLPPLPTAGKMSSLNYKADLDGLIESLENEVKQHQSKAANFRFYAEHLFTEATYSLSTSDFHLLEMLK